LAKYAIRLIAFAKCSQRAALIGGFFVSKFYLKSKASNAIAKRCCEAQIAAGYTPLLQIFSGSFLKICQKRRAKNFLGAIYLAATVIWLN
jgi:hypothetical protein